MFPVERGDSQFRTLLSFTFEEWPFLRQLPRREGNYSLISITSSPDRSIAIMRLSGLTLHHRDLRSNCYSSMHVINPATLRTPALSFNILLRDKKNVWSFIYIFFIRKKSIFNSNLLE